MIAWRAGEGANGEGNAVMGSALGGPWASGLLLCQLNCNRALEGGHMLKSYPCVG